MQDGSNCRRWAAVLAALAATTGAGEPKAQADDPQTGAASNARGAVPPITPYVKRGMLYGPGQAGLTLGLDAVVEAAHRSSAAASLGIAFGITSRLTFEASLGTLTFAPEARYRSPQVGLWLGIVDTPPFELDTTARLTFGVGDEGPVREVEPGVVAVIRPDDRLRLDVAAYLPMARAGSAGPGLRAPFQLALQINPYLHAALSSGVAVTQLGESSPAVPLGLALGCTVPLDRGGYAVVSPSVSWPRLAGGEGPLPRPMVLGVVLALVTPP